MSSETQVHNQELSQPRPSEDQVIHTTRCDGRPATFKISADGTKLTLTVGYGNYIDGVPDKTFIYNFILKSEDQVNQKLSNPDYKSTDMSLANPVIERYDVMSMETKEGRGEDRFSVDFFNLELLIQKLSENPSGIMSLWPEIKSRSQMDHEPGDLLVENRVKPDIFLWSVIDGHVSSTLSELLSFVLHPELARNLVGVDLNDPEEVSNTIKVSFSNLDKEILDNVVQSVDQLVAMPGKVGLMNMRELLRSGACAATVMVDSINGRIYTANVGDTRIVAVWFNPEQKSWKYEVLSNDNQAANPKEVERLCKEHPGEESDVIYDGGDHPRVLNVLQPTRAFGDFRFKITDKEGDHLRSICGVPKPWPEWARPNCTPPYVSAEPEVNWRPLKLDSGEVLDRVFAATDGIWDLATSAEVAQLSIAHRTHPNHPPISKKQLNDDFPVSKTEGNDTWPEQPLPASTEEASSGTWNFETDNVAEHIFRNIIGKGDPFLRRSILSLDGEAARRMRDDQTLAVITFNHDEHD